MVCPACGGPTVAFPIPGAVVDQMPEARPGAALCRHCLTVVPLDDPPAEIPDLQTVSDAFPSNREGAATVGALLALVDSLALYRTEIDAVARHAETLGVDVMLVLDRLAADEAIDPHFDIDRRRAQLEQLLA